MALNQINKLVWIVETIYKAGKISFEELNEKWMENVTVSYGAELLKRTFHKWRSNICDTFGIDIECEKSAPYRYFIANEDAMRDGTIENWLLGTYSVSNSLVEYKSVSDRILLENVPSGGKHLESILDAMKRSLVISIIYRNYWREDEREHCIMPLCVKLFRQRWYVLGRYEASKNDKLFSLDRIIDLRLSNHTFEYPKDFDAKEYFDGCFGIIADKECQAEDVLLKVNYYQANYMRDLPMHDSQVEIECNDEYSLFKLRVKPTYDFKQELLWNNEELEVLAPQWLRDDVAGIIERMGGKYKKRTKCKVLQH